MKSPVTTHVLDTHRGRPASGVPVQLEQKRGDQWVLVAKGVTNVYGRIDDWFTGVAEKGSYRMTFDTAAYSKELSEENFYPQVVITFLLNYPDEHYHVPLLLSGHGYSTYRGS